MDGKCPGRDGRDLKTETVRCVCGYEVELFSDEFRRVCPRCRSEVVRKKLPSCVEWCKSADRCMGTRRPENT